MPKFATIREVKNQTTALIRVAEKGTAVVVTRRGRPVATLRSFEPKDLQREKYPTAAMDSLRANILRKYPALAKETPERAKNEFERITEKVRRSLPFRTWQDMDRFAKGDRYGAAR